MIGVCLRAMHVDLLREQRLPFGNHELESSISVYLLLVHTSACTQVSIADGLKVGHCKGKHAAATSPLLPPARGTPAQGTGGIDAG